MKYIVTASHGYDEYNNCWDFSSGEDEMTALVAKADPAGLATLCDNVDELNILLDMFGRADLPDIITMFGGKLYLDAMHLMARNPSAADIEEWFFSNQYANWANRKYDEASTRMFFEHRDVLKKHIVNYDGDGYDAMLAIAEEKSLMPVSREKYDDVLARKVRSVRSEYTDKSEKWQVYVANLFALEDITENIFKLDYCYASKEAKALRDQWCIGPDQSTVPEDEDSAYRIFTRDITISLFQMPSNGVLVLSNSSSNSYYCD